MAIPMVQGDEIDIGFTTDISMGTPQEVRFVLQKNNTPLVHKSIGQGDVVVDSTTHFTVTFHEADTLELPVGNYDIQALMEEEVTGDRKSIKLDQGIMTLTKRLTFAF
jgi:hypothetical protein